MSLYGDNMPSRSHIESGAPVAVLDDVRAPVPDVEAGSYPGRIWAEYARVGGGSTSWVNLTGSLVNADTCVEEGLFVEGSAAYWTCAWSGYELAQNQLSANDRRLADAYNLDELPVCSWCKTRDTEDQFAVYSPQIGENPDSVHAACLAEALREQGL